MFFNLTLKVSIKKMFLNSKKQKRDKDNLKEPLCVPIIFLQSWSLLDIKLNSDLFWLIMFILFPRLLSCFGSIWNLKIRQTDGCMSFSGILEHALAPFPKCGPWANDIAITRERIWNAERQAAAQTLTFRLCILIRLRMGFLNTLNFEKRLNSPAYLSRARFCKFT